MAKLVEIVAQVLCIRFRKRASPVGPTGGTITQRLTRHPKILILILKTFAAAAAAIGRSSRHSKSNSFFVMITKPSLLLKLSCVTTPDF